MSHVLLLRYSDTRGGRLAAMVRPAGIGPVLEEIVDSDEPGDRAWLDCPDEHAVLIGTNRPVFITDPEELVLVSFWLAAAADLLKKRKAHGGAP